MLVQYDQRDDVARARLLALVDKLLSLIEAQPLQGWMKLWLLNFYVVSKFQCMLTIYDFPLTFVFELEKMYTRLAKKWLGLPPSAPPDLLYVSHARHGWQLNAIGSTARCFARNKPRSKTRSRRREPWTRAVCCL